MAIPFDRVAAAALERYDFSPDAKATLISVSENAIYRVDDPHTGRSAALRIHRPGDHSDTAIRSELRWMDALREAGVVETPQVISARSGCRVITVDVDGIGAPRAVVVFEWLPGEPPGDERDLISAFRVLGELAAKMHLHGQSWARPRWFERYTCDFEVALGSGARWGRWQDGFDIDPEGRQILTRLDSEIQRRLTEYGTQADRFGLAHSDLRLANLLVEEGHVYVIDFDDCGFTWYMYDFATAVSFLEDDPRLLELMAAWVDGYRVHRPLQPEDLEILPTLIMFRRLILMGWVGSHYDYCAEAVEVRPGFTDATCSLGEAYLADRLGR